MLKKLYSNKILVKPNDPKEKSLIYAEDHTIETCTGEVILVGTSKANEPMEIKVGETVLFSIKSATKVSYDGEDYLLLRDSDVHGVE